MGSNRVSFKKVNPGAKIFRTTVVNHIFQNINLLCSGEGCVTRCKESCKENVEINDLMKNLILFYTEPVVIVVVVEHTIVFGTSSIDGKDSFSLC